MGLNNKFNVHIDGSRVMKSDATVKKEREVSKEIEKRLGVKIFWNPELCPVDFCFVACDRVIGIGELRTRTHKYGTYPTIYLGWDKWCNLMLYQEAFRHPAMFIVSYTDDIYWIRASDIDVGLLGVKLGGGRFDEKNWEPLIEIPIEQLVKLEKGNLPDWPEGHTKVR